MVRIFVFLAACYIISCSGDDPRDISDLLQLHVKSQVQYLPSRVALGNLTFQDVVMPNAQMGDLKSIRLVGRAWFWRKFIWFSVFGDVRFEDLYLTARTFTINGRSHTGKIVIGDNTLHFNWEAIDHFRCTIVRERIDWLPLKNFSLKEGNTTTELIFSDDEVLNLKKRLMNANFVNRIREVFIQSIRPCLFLKYPSDYSWEDQE